MVMSQIGIINANARPDLVKFDSDHHLRAPNLKIVTILVPLYRIKEEKDLKSVDLSFWLDQKFKKKSFLTGAFHKKLPPNSRRKKFYCRRTKLDNCRFLIIKGLN